MDPAILADRTDNNAREAAEVSETRATAPVFPPGRYGRRRDRRRSRLLPVIFGVLVLAVSVLASVRLYQQYGGDPDYDPQIVGWSDVTDTSMTVRFTVRVPAGGSAVCVLRARTYDGAEVGRREVTVSAAGDARQIRAEEAVPTSARAAVGDVIRCRPPG
jgi:hypothetical protein